MKFKKDLNVLDVFLDSPKISDAFNPDEILLRTAAGLYAGLNVYFTEEEIDSMKRNPKWNPDSARSMFALQLTYNFKTQSVTGIRLDFAFNGFDVEYEFNKEDLKKIHATVEKLKIKCENEDITKEEQVTDLSDLPSLEWFKGKPERIYAWITWWETYYGENFIDSNNVEGKDFLDWAKNKGYITKDELSRMIEESEYTDIQRILSGDCFIRDADLDDTEDWLYEARCNQLLAEFLAEDTPVEKSDTGWLEWFQESLAGIDKKETNMSELEIKDFDKKEWLVTGRWNMQSPPTLASEYGGLFILNEEARAKFKGNNQTVNASDFSNS